MNLKENRDLAQVQGYHTALLKWQDFPESFLKHLSKYKKFSCTPTYPWAQNFYSHLISHHNLANQGIYSEFGVALGGMSFFLAELFRNQVSGYAFDTFEGAPMDSGPRENPYYKAGDYGPQDGRDLLEEFKKNSSEFGLNITPIKGDFTKLTDLPFEEELSFVHLDCNLYDSTLSALELIYPKLISGGAIAIDEFFHPSDGVKRAVVDYFRKYDITPRAHICFPYSVVIFKDEETGQDGPCLDGVIYDFDLLQSNQDFKQAVHSLVESEQWKANFDYPSLQLLHGLLNRPTNTYDMHLYIFALQGFFNTTFQNLDVYKSRELLKK